MSKQNCKIKNASVNKLYNVYVKDLKNMTNFMVATPSFKQWFAMQQTGVSAIFKKASHV